MTVNVQLITKIFCLVILDFVTVYQARHFPLSRDWKGITTGQIIKTGYNLISLASCFQDERIKAF